MSNDLHRDPNILALSSVLGEPTFSPSSDEVRFSSPFRDKFKDPSKPDRKKHLYVNPIKGKFTCYKSSVAGSLSYLFQLLGLSMSEAPPVNEDLATLRKRLSALDDGTKFVIPTASLPDWYTPVIAGSEVHRYLHSRQVSDEDIVYYHIGEGSGEWDGWLCVPNLNRSGVCEYWVARSVRHKNYQNPESGRRHHVLFLDAAVAVSPKEIIICEGVFSAIAAGRDAVATLGKLVTDAQLRRIADAGVLCVNLALDGDAWVETLDTAERCLRIGLETNVIPLPKDQDPDDIGRTCFQALKVAATIPMSFERLSKLRLINLG